MSADIERSGPKPISDWPESLLVSAKEIHKTEKGDF